MAVLSAWTTPVHLIAAEKDIVYDDSFDENDDEYELCLTPSFWIID